MRRTGAVLCLILFGCGQADDAPAGEPITCALAGASGFAPACRAERAVIDGRPAVVVHHPDGGFRRLVLSADRQHLEAADGADEAQSARKGDRYEVIVGGDKYVIPVSDAAAR